MIKVGNGKKTVRRNIERSRNAIAGVTRDNCMVTSTVALGSAKIENGSKEESKNGGKQHILELAKDTAERSVYLYVESQQMWVDNVPEAGS